MSVLGILIVIIVACVLLSTLMLGLILVSETTRDVRPLFQAAVATVIVLFSVLGLRHAKWAMDHHTVVQPAFSWQYRRAWMHPIQAMFAFGSTAAFGVLGVADALRRWRR